MPGRRRTPDPPRRVPAPAPRHSAPHGSDPARRRLLLYGLGLVVLIGVAVALAVVFASGSGGGGNGEAGNPSRVAAAMEAVGCTLTTTDASKSNQHISKPDQVVTYSTYPPASGLHHPAPALWGNYSQPVDPRQAVHNLEHGGIVIWYGPDVSDAERRRIGDFYDESPNAMLVTPVEDTADFVKYPKHRPPGSRVYLTAWTVKIEDSNAVSGKNVVASCPRFDEQAFAAFRNEFRGKGPERFPVSSLTPGT